MPVGRSPGLKEKVLELARANPRYGFRRVHALLPGDNVRAVHRIWKEEGPCPRHRKRRKLVVPKTEGPGPYWGKPKPGAWTSAASGLRTAVTRAFSAPWTAFTRECLLLKAASAFPDFAVEKELEWLFLVHGRPRAIVSDNGPEFRAMTLPDGVSNRFIQPGKPWQNGYIESFFGKLRDELLSCGLFVRGAELQAALTDFQDHYYNHRPHLGLGGLTPTSFKKKSQGTRPEEAILKS